MNSRRGSRADGTLSCAHPRCKATWTLATGRSEQARLARLYPSTPEMEAWIADAAPMIARDDGWGEMFDGTMRCPTHNQKPHTSYTVHCSHRGCKAAYTRTFHRAADDTAQAFDLAAIEALSQRGWGMARNKSLLCSAHSEVRGRIVLSAT